MIAAHDFYENPFAKFWISDEVLFFQYKSNTIIDLKVAQLVVTDRIHLQGERAYPILCDLRGVVTANKAGRDYLAQSGSVLAIAVGLVVHESHLVAISNFYLEVNKPVVPTKIFSTDIDALQYLQDFKGG